MLNDASDTTAKEGESDSNVKVLKDASDTTEKEGESDERNESEVEESVRLFPDESNVKISNKKLTIVNKPPRLRSETKGQYMCQLALQFTCNHHKMTVKIPFCMLYFTHLSLILILH